MATAVQKITFSSSRDIPFNKFALSLSNVRNVKARVSLAGHPNLGRLCSATATWIQNQAALTESNPHIRTS